MSVQPTDYAITFACYNAVDYTRKCVDSLLAAGTPLSRLVVVDNASHDDTREYLNTLALGGRIDNRGNLSCGTAWTQGALHLQAEWTIVMNNDVLVAPGWIEGLIATARAQGLKIISPAMIELDEDYGFAQFAPQAMQTMGQVLRRGAQHAVCMAIHWSVFEQIGFFRAEPKLLGIEDALFFHAVRKAGIPAAMTGASWLHHYGSITQSLMKQERGMRASADLGYPGKKVIDQSFLERKWVKFQRKRQNRAWRDAELAQYGMSLHGMRRHGAFTWL